MFRRQISVPVLFICRKGDGDHSWLILRHLGDLCCTGHGNPIDKQEETYTNTNNPEKIIQTLKKIEL